MIRFPLAILLTLTLSAAHADMLLTGVGGAAAAGPSCNFGSGNLTIGGVNNVPPGGQIGYTYYDNPGGTNIPTGPYWADTNPFGVDTSTTPFTLQLNFYTGSGFAGSQPTKFPNCTQIVYSFPNTPAPGGKYAFPEVVYGSMPYTFPTNRLPTGSIKISQFNTFSVTYSYAITGANPTNFDQIWDIWGLTAANGGPAQREYEFIIMSHVNWLAGVPWNACTAGGGWTSAGTGTDAVFGTYTICYCPGCYGWTPIVIQPQGQTDRLNGTINLLGMMNQAKTGGAISDDPFISGVEFGPEMDQGAATVNITTLSYTVNFLLNRDMRYDNDNLPAFLAVAG